MSTIPDTPVFEVFVQADALSFASHVGSVRAANAELALQMAREAYLRRDSAYDVWVVPESAITHARTDGDTLPVEPETKRYRLPSGYDNAPHWKRFKARAQTIDEVAAEMRSPARKERS